MAFDKWALPCSVLILLVSTFVDVDAQVEANDSSSAIHSTKCADVDYTEEYGVFTSPKYPRTYDNNVECIYRITPPAIGSITLNFETFELDRSPGDYVSISCESDPSYVPKNYSWNSYIPPISMPSCTIGRLYFRSDSYRPFYTRGFRVQYQVNTEGCGNTAFIEQNGTISWPNYSKKYNKHENCTYSIWAPETSSFTLSFQAFNLNSDCRYGWVQIWCDNFMYILPKYCGSALPRPAFIHNCNKVLVWFHTDHSDVIGGFSLQYSVIPNGCGRSIYGGLSGIITSPDYPRAYNRRSCFYNLYPVSSVVLAFESFNLEPFIDKNFGDFVQVDLHFINSTTVSRSYYGTTLPPLITCTLCYRIQFFFNTNFAISGTGFSVRYQINPMVASSAITSSPKNFTVEVGSRVELTCRSDAIDYYPSWTLSKDGTDETTTVIASFCVVNFDYASLYYTARYGPGVCNLVIINATLVETGIYTCIDVGLASSSSVVTVVEFNSAPASYDQGDSDATVIALSVLLAICILGYIGEAIFFIVRRHQKTSSYEGQRERNQDVRPTVTDFVKPQAAKSGYVGPPVRRVFSPEYPAAPYKYNQFG